MQKCPKCSQQYENPAKICRRCGAILDAVAEDIVAKDAVPEDVVAENPGEKNETPAPPPGANATPSHSGVTIWSCPNCRQSVPDTFEICWNCGTDREGTADPAFEKLSCETDSNEIEETQDVPEPSPQSNIQCSYCGSAKIIPHVQIVDQGEYSNGFLQVVIYGSPNALIFKDRLYGKLNARICGGCGHVELQVENPQELYEHFLEASKP
jgi:hypothetical protein